MEQEQVKDLVLKIARSLVDHPEEVSVNVIDSGHTVVLELKVAKVDIGKVIGKQGRTVDSIRTLMGAMSGKTRKRLMLEIVDQR